MRNLVSLVVVAHLCLYSKLAAQSIPTPPLNNVISIPAKYLKKVEDKFSKVNNDITHQTEKYIQRLQKQEDKLNRKLSKYESAATSHLNDGQKFYAGLLGKINSQVNTSKMGVAGNYLPYVDSVQTSLAFLEQNNQLLSASKNVQGKVQASLGQVKEAQARLQIAEKIKQLIQQRQAQLKAQLSQYTNLPASVNKLYAGYAHNYYYYSAQLKEYKDIINDPDKLTRKTLSFLDQSNAFQQFAKKYSQLAGLFGLPANYASTQSIAGLQTRSMIQQQIQAQLAAAGPNGMQMLQQNLQAAQAQLNQFKDKLSKLGSNSGDMAMPDFKPKGLKTKSLWQRLEYGTNLQTTRSSVFYPQITDVGGSVGYKLSEKSSIGIGASAKIGWGKDIRHISITGQGVGLRSYVDVQLKKSFYGSGGFEYNYTQVLQEFRELRDFSLWQRSALIGISKIVSLKGKWAKKTKLQLLYDFLYRQQVPQTNQPFKFRIGYTF
jgi:hypothetical protein